MATAGVTCVLIACLLALSSVPDFFIMARGLAGRGLWWEPGRPQRLQQKRLGAAVQPTLDPRTITDAVKFAEISSTRLARLENTLIGADMRVVPGTAAHGALIASFPATPEALSRHSEAQLALRASQFLADNNCRRFSLKEKLCGSFVNSVPLSGTILAASCAASVCEERNPKYRSHDGSCNNPKRKGWGSALTAYRRLLPASYADGLQSPRGERSLPGPHEASEALVTSDSPNSSKIIETSLATALWAQLVSMDLAHTPTAIMVSTGSSISCCKPDGGFLPPRSRHPSCLPVTVSHGERRCLDFVRSLIAPRPDCRFGNAEQMNQATHWLDGSPLYGSNVDVSRGMREFQGGRLALSQGNLLPLAPEPTSACQITEKPTGPCFRAGDSRVNEQPLLTVLLTLLAREHNRVASQLNELNPQWTDEILYHEARRVVLAELQHITYHHWLPAVVGTTAAEEVLHAQYSQEADPSVLNSLAVLPFTLSMLPTSFQLYGEDKSGNDSFRLRHHYNKPAIIAEKDNFDEMIRTLATQQAQPVDLVHTEDVTRGFYAAEGGTGLDGVSLAVQRGRDHGLPGYNAFRVACGLPSAKTFQDFANIMEPKVIAGLSKVYRSPDDVDLYLGAVAEKPSADSLVGPTLQCLLVKQLKDTRRADRHFFDLEALPPQYALSPAQVQEIRKTSLARIFCDNGDNITSMQLNVFHTAGSTENRVVPCSAVPGVNLSAWKIQEATR